MEMDKTKQKSRNARSNNSTGLGSGGSLHKSAFSMTHNPDIFSTLNKYIKDTMADTKKKTNDHKRKIAEIHLPVDAFESSASPVRKSQIAKKG